MGIYEYNEEEHIQMEREDAKKEGIQEGQQQGEARINRLNNRLIELGRVEDVVRAASDMEYQKRLLEELNL